MMIGFCKQQGIDDIDVLEYVRLPSKSGEKQRFVWFAKERNNQIAVFQSQDAAVSLEAGPYLVFMQGFCHPDETATFASNEAFLERLLQAYRDSGNFVVPTYHGSYTITLVDGTSGKVFLYRNFVGSSFTYYTQTPQGFFWGDTFSEVAKTRRNNMSVNESMLPVLFLMRYPTGKQTLVENVFRLMPGELVTFDGKQISSQQAVTLDDFSESYKTNEAESIERVEVVTAEIMRDWCHLYPNTANLLSGGVDSTYLQVHWNHCWQQACGRIGERPLSAVVWLDHEMTVPDLEYTMSAVELLGTNNIAVRQAPLTAEQMTGVIRRNGEFPNHVQSFYFDTLARELKEQGISAGIIGEGADGLFGGDAPDTIRKAFLWRRRIPLQWGRTIMAALARTLGGHYTSDMILTAQIITQISHPDHPVNQAAAFTDLKTLRHCFGDSALQSTVSYRQNILETVRVPVDQKYLQWSVANGYFSEAIVTASYWSKLFAESGLAMCSLFLDSRMIRAALNIRLDSHFVPETTKAILKHALGRHVPDEFIHRPKRGFGQPYLEWLSPGGTLRERAEAIRTTSWFDETTKQSLLAGPNWFLWTMLCYDIWHETMFA
ncbi:MAG: asparagine synthase C-terminal domain-containing protein [Planctomycetaceae bacterium]|nr:asparagine synthase C-terminal domain-containing protein [Planctomycetaceae bacterium]